MKYLCVAIFVFYLVFSCVNARCREAGACCPGKNNTCRADDFSARGVCYCDEFCVKTGDCCDDYDYYCRKQDCVMTWWSHWSTCSSKCGRGKYSRTRKVHIPSSGGGKSCGSRRQVAICYGNDYSCGKKEVAMILPTYYKPYRKQNDKSPKYCIKYRVLSLTKGCSYATPWYLLKKDDDICVECAYPAIKDGRCQGSNIGEVSQWMGVQVSGCFGSWKSVSTIIHDCECGYNHGNDFIFA